MDKLFERHDIYLSGVPMDYTRDIMKAINWNARYMPYALDSQRQEPSVRLSWPTR